MNLPCLYLSIRGQKIRVEQRISRARKSRVSFHYHPEKVLFVTAPTQLSSKELFNLAKTNESSVLKLMQAAQTNPQICYPLNYEDGCTILVLSNPVCVKVKTSNRIQPSFHGNCLTIKKPIDVSLKGVIFAWYKVHATAIFQERIAQMCELANFVGVVPPWSHRFMSSLWGSCNRDRKVKLNTHLIKVPLEAIDLVIMHELCHFEHQNHSRAFYDLLAEQLPNWKQTDKLLRNYAMLLNEERPPERYRQSRKRVRFGA